MCKLINYLTLKMLKLFRNSSLRNIAWLVAQGEYEMGVDHLTNAIAVCGQQQKLLQV